MTMKIKPDTLRLEIRQVIDMLSSWSTRLDEGVPGDEVPTSRELDVEIFQYQLRGEIQLAGERLMALVEVLSND